MMITQTKDRSIPQIFLILPVLKNSLTFRMVFFSLIENKVSVLRNLKSGVWRPLMDRMKNAPMLVQKWWELVFSGRCLEIWYWSPGPP